VNYIALAQDKGLWLALVVRWGTIRCDNNREFLK